MRKILRYLCILLAAALVFYAAKYLDEGPATEEAPSLRQETQTRETNGEDVPETQSVSSQTVPEETAPSTEPVKEGSFLLSFVGDCTLGCRDSHSYIDIGFTKVVGEDYGYPFRNVLDYFEKDEATFINLEGALTDEGNARKKAHTFRGPTSYVNILTQNSVEFASLANNHTMDYNQLGYDSTKATLENAGVPYVERDSSTIFTTENGLTVGVYGAVYYLLDEKVITAAISELSEQVDLVIFAPHWGTEKSYNPLQDQINLAHAVIDAGADIVWGSHPHALQPIEEYNDGIIFYSMGNFSFGGNIYPEDYDSALIQQEVLVADDGSVSLGETVIVPVCISGHADRNDFQPVPYQEGTEEYDRVLAKLSGTWK